MTPTNESQPTFSWTWKQQRAQPRRAVSHVEAPRLVLPHEQTRGSQWWDSSQPSSNNPCLKFEDSKIALGARYATSGILGETAAGIDRSLTHAWTWTEKQGSPVSKLGYTQFLFEDLSSKTECRLKGTSGLTGLIALVMASRSSVNIPAGWFISTSQNNHDYFCCATHLKYLEIHRLPRIISLPIQANLPPSPHPATP